MAVRPHSPCPTEVFRPPTGPKRHFSVRYSGPKGSDNPNAIETERQRRLWVFGRQFPRRAAAHQCRARQPRDSLLETCLLASCCVSWRSMKKPTRLASACSINPPVNLFRRPWVQVAGTGFEPVTLGLWATGQSFHADHMRRLCRTSRNMAWIASPSISSNTSSSRVNFTRDNNVSISADSSW